MLLEKSLLELTLLDRAWGQRHAHHRLGPRQDTEPGSEQGELWGLAARVEPEEQQASEDMGTRTGI